MHSGTPRNKPNITNTNAPAAVDDPSDWDRMSVTATKEISTTRMPRSEVQAFMIADRLLKRILCVSEAVRSRDCITGNPAHHVCSLSGMNFYPLSDHLSSYHTKGKTSNGGDPQR